MADEKVSLRDLAGAQPGDEGYTPPLTTVPFPSRGKTYPVESPLYGKESLDIRGMTADDENILSSRSLLKNGTAMAALIKACVTQRTIDPEELLLGDRNALLIAIRISGYGAEYAAEVTCPACDETAKHSFDLSRLPLKNLDVDPAAPATNRFAYELPISKRRVEFRLVDGRMAHELDRTAANQRKAKAEEKPITAKLTAQVISIGGIEDRTKVAALVRTMSARDARALRTYIEKIEPEVSMRQTYRCAACSAETEVIVPMGPEFFWPELGM